MKCIEAMRQKNTTASIKLNLQIAYTNKTNKQTCTAAINLGFAVH